MKFVTIIFLLILSTPALAGVYKCQDAAGRIVYQGAPCEDPAEAREVVLQDATSPPPGAEPEVEFTGSVASQISQIAAVISVGASKGWDCRLAVKVTKKMAPCRDFLGFIKPGGPYQRAAARLLILANSEEGQDYSSSEVYIMTRDIEKINRDKDLVLAYLRYK